MFCTQIAGYAGSLGMESGAIPASAVKPSSERSYRTIATYGRLHLKETVDRSGGMDSPGK